MSRPRPSPMAPAFGSPLSDETPSPGAGDVEALARRGMAFALMGDRTRLQVVSASAEATEMRRDPDAPRDGPSARVSDNLALLEAWLTPERSQRHALLRRIIAANPDRQVLRHARHALAQDPLNQIRRLRTEDRYNRFAGVFNYFSDLVGGLAAGNIQRLAQLGADVFFLWQPMLETSPRNRLAYDIAMRRTGEIAAAGAEAKDLAPYIRRLDKRIREARTREAVGRAEWRLRNGQWEEARQAFSAALEADPGRASRAGRASALSGRLKAARRVSAEERARLRSLTMVAEVAAASAKEAAAAAELAAALCISPAREAASGARRFQDDFPASPLWDDAVYAEMIALERLQADAGFDSALEGGPQNRQPRERLESREMAHSGIPCAKTNAARHLKAFEGADAANPWAALRQAGRIRKAERWQYALLGDNLTAESPQILTSRERLHRLTDSLSLLLPFLWVVRGIECVYGCPVPDDSWRSAAVRCLSRPPTDFMGEDPMQTQRREAALALANSYEKLGRFDSARFYHGIGKGGGDPAYDAALDEKAARRLLRGAKGAADPGEKRRLFERTARSFPATKAGRKAEELVRRMGEEETDLLQITKAELIDWPDLWRRSTAPLRTGLRLDPNWLDGEAANGEMTSDGVHFLLPDGRTIVFTVKERKGRFTGSLRARHTLRLDDAAHRALEPRLQAWQREKEARSRIEAAGEGLRALAPWRFPLEVEGAAGPGGFDLYPRLLPLPFDAESLPLYQPSFQVQ